MGGGEEESEPTSSSAIREDTPPPTSSSSTATPTEAMEPSQPTSSSSAAAGWQPSNLSSWSTEANFNGILRTHILEVNSPIDPALFLTQEESNIVRLVYFDLAEHRGIKCHFVLQLEMSKVDLSSGEVTIVKPFFNSGIFIVHNESEISGSYEDGVLNILEDISNFTENGSNFNVEKVLKFEIHTTKYTPLQGKGYFPLPKFIVSKKACINLKSTDEFCFMWACLLSLNFDRVNIKNCARRPASSLSKFKNQLNFRGISFPVKLKDIDKFEKQNDVAVTVLGFEKNEFFPLRVSKHLCDANRSRIDLLFVQNEENSGHYVWIKNLDKLLSSCRSSHNGRKFTCRSCFHQFAYGGNLEAHEPQCLVHHGQKLVFPEEKARIVSFTKQKQTLLRPYICCADFEMILKPKRDKSLVSEHVPLALSYIVFDTKGDPVGNQKVFYGENCAVDFLLDIKAVHEKLEEETRQRMKPLTHAQQLIMMDPFAECMLCKKNVEPPERVAHHDHLTGNFISVLCNPCNLSLTLSRNMVVAFHCGSRYDFIAIVNALKVCAGEDEVTVIGKSVEKFSTIRWGKIEFIDSYNLLSGSLATLASTLQPSQFRLIRSFFPEDEKFQLVSQKMSFPYNHFKNESVLKETSIPPRSAYYNDLSDSECTEEDYERAKKIWEVFKLKDLKQLLSLYVRCDVLILCDVLITFREFLYQHFELDIFHFISLPSFSFAACLKSANLRLELLGDSEQHLFWQRAKFGGFCTVVRQYFKANNAQCSDFDPEKPGSYLMYMDAIGLYATTMLLNKFPIGNFSFCPETEVNTTDWTTLDSQGEVGYLLEASFEFPVEIHDLLSDYPPCPLKREVKPHELSERSKILATLLEINPEQKTEKLISDLHARNNYVLPLPSLQLVLSLGAKLVKVHRVMRFKQAAVLAPYISRCMALRQKATTTFESNQLKLLCNSFFGFSIRNVLMDRDFRLVFEAHKLQKLINSPLYYRSTSFAKDAAIVEMKRKSVKVMQPVYLGISVLALSKNIMLDFWYNHVKKHYGEKAVLCASDTDSFIFGVYTDSANFYETDIAPLFKNILDTSNYNPSHPLYSLERKKKPGCFTDELGGKILQEIVCLKPKSYSCRIKDAPILVRSKGVPKACQTRFVFDDYKNCLLSGEEKHVTFKMIGSKRMKLYTVKCSKLALSSFENKRYWLDKDFVSLPFGHYAIDAATANDNDDDV